MIKMSNIVCPNSIGESAPNINLEDLDFLSYLDKIK